MIEEGSPINNQNGQNPNWQSNLILVTIGLILTITAIIFYPDTREKMLAVPPDTHQPALMTNLPDQNSPAAVVQPPPTAAISTPTPEVFIQTSQIGTLVIALREGTDSHLFLYRPFLENSAGEDLTALALTRITTGSHQDVTPAINPDGTKIAFASNRNGPWDIYILDLITNQISRFTESLAYEGNPTWSPDGQWLAYESYQVDNLDIYIQSIDKTSGPIPLTNHPAADFSPNWSGEGRKISFVSTRNGRQEIWYADLDSTKSDKAVRVPGFESRTAAHPNWSADGRFLSWSVVTQAGDHSLVVWDSTKPEDLPVYAGPGDWPVWGGGGEILFSGIKTPSQSYLTAYPRHKDQVHVMLPAIGLPGNLEGISWVQDLTINTELDDAGEVSPTPLWQYPANLADQKTDLIQVRNLEAPYPQFIQAAQSSFSSLRQKTREEAGWDFLSTLEYAFLPLAEKLALGTNLNWLYSGRGLMINDIPRSADWMIVMREEYQGRTYWRVYLRANDQQGYQGRPVNNFPWDFEARYNNSNTAYENGGEYALTIPSGYWVDFTELAAAYGWVRFPAINYWQYSETASRYQYFAYTQGLSLDSALMQLYTPAAIQDLITSPDP